MGHLRIALCVLAALVAFATATPLDDYVNAPDPTYKYEVKNIIKAEAITIYIVNMTSQTWLTPKDVSRSVWFHYMVICVPNNDLKYNTGFLYIDGGDNTDGLPNDIDPLTELVCLATNAVTAHLYQIPNQPVYFADGKRRSEDALIAYTWSHFINNTNEPNWLARLPMTKACVRALDTMADVVAKYVPSAPVINQFVVAGASKRGWTTWTTAAVDKRVVAIAPMVIPVLNIVPNIGHQWQAYGGWSFALDDYLDMHLMAYLNQPQFQMMADIIDPYVYIDRLTMPKYIICSTGDEFFLPDSPSYFFDKLKGEKHLYMVPNAEHSLTGHQAIVGIAIASFSDMFLKGTPRPQANWTIDYTQDGATITVYSKTKPQTATMWHAQTLTNVKRDFRLVTCWNIEECFQPVFWYESSLQDQGNSVYVAKLANPPNGWAGFYVELDFYPDTSNPLADSLRITTEIVIVPNTLPYPPCGNHCQ